ncbi:MAG: S8 family peptidase [Eubacteriales bacterium]|nr:S8 family peptidase [Eubacteriales bacterium]
MKNQKLENLLNLALDTPPQERARSSELETGYLLEEQAWELIVRYSGSLDAVRAMGIRAVELRGGYAVMTVPEPLIEAVSALPQIEYVEMPKRLFFSAGRARASSCVNVLQEEPYFLSGKGVLVAVLDSGIDYYHEAFRTPEGDTRIAALWDQTLDRVFSRDEINEAVHSGSRETARSLVPSADGSGHGTAVAGIAAGSGRGGAGSAERGLAYESELLVVKLGHAGPRSFPRTTELMRGVDFAVSRAVERSRPLAVNISFGNTYGSHDGSSLLETFLDDIGSYGKTVIVTGSGNEGASGGHASGQAEPLQPGQPAGSRRSREIREELSVAPYESSFSVQLWKSYTDTFRVSLQTPSGELLGPIREELGPVRFSRGDTDILVYYGKPGPYSQAQEIYFDFVPEAGGYVETGIWTFVMQPERIVEGRYDLWLPSAGILNTATRFLRPSPDTTLTIPSTASGVITVGAYDSTYNSYADFSGRGFTRRTNQVKPDLAAPGVGLTAPAAGGGYRTVTGTSFAAPVVAGSAALMMQWGIADGNDPFLYGEKVKAYLHRGAKPLPGIREYPNPLVGYGALCLRDSLPLQA